MEIFNIKKLSNILYVSFKVNFVLGFLIWLLILIKKDYRNIKILI